MNIILNPFSFILTSAAAPCSASRAGLAQNASVCARFVPLVSPPRCCRVPRDPPPPMTSRPLHPLSSPIWGHVATRHTPRSTTRRRSSIVRHPHPPRNIIPRIPPTISPSASAPAFFSSSSSSSAFGHYINYE